MLRGIELQSVAVVLSRQDINTCTCLLAISWLRLSLVAALLGPYTAVGSFLSFFLPDLFDQTFFFDEF